jgi:multisubunit Na+/H+ antiporter MnhB subunit
MSNVPGSANPNARAVRPVRSAETKPFYKTTEFIVYVVVALAVLIAAALVDNGEDGQGFGAWMYVTWLTVGYMISRGLAKAGSRSHRHDD